jgi:hypothetical protein
VGSIPAGRTIRFALFGAFTHGKPSIVQLDRFRQEAQSKEPRLASARRLVGSIPAGRTIQFLTITKYRTNFVFINKPSEIAKGQASLTVRKRVGKSVRFLRTIDATEAIRALESVRVTPVAGDFQS